MSIIERDTIDGVALTKDRNGIVLLITDHLDWDDEYHHLLTLQEKINAYIGFIEEKQYCDIYKDVEIKYGVIEIRFMYILTENAQKFLQTVQDQVGSLGIRIQYCISED